MAAPDSKLRRERFPGVDVTLGQSIYGGSRSSHKKKSLTRSKTLPQQLTRLPPAVVNVPKDDVQGYVHSKKVNNYLIGPTLGEGSFAKVKEAFHVLVGEKVAIKIIDKKKAQDDPYVAKNFKREAKLLQKLSHPNIIRLYEVVETEHNYYLVTELCTGGDLMKYIYKCGRLKEEEAQKYIRQLVSAVDHLHKAGLIHRDLKVENLLLDHDKNLKLIDFGLSNEEYIRDQSGSEVHCRTQCGSPAYAAPELLGQKQYDHSADIWSIGVNLYAMLTGMLPFTVEPFNVTALHAKMLQSKMNPIPEHVSENCKDLLQKLLIVSPEKRITMPDIFAHPWLKDDTFNPTPYPNHITADKINVDIIEHMTGTMDLIASESEIRHELILNRATSSYSIYHLLEARLARYQREFPKRVLPKSKKVDDDDGIPMVKSERKIHGPTGVPLRQNHSRQQPKPRPISDVNPLNCTNPPSADRPRRLSNILEERRGSAPPDILAEQLAELRRRPTTQQQHFRHPKHSDRTSPTREGYNPSRRGGSLKRNHKSLPQDMQRIVQQAWPSNPPSRQSSHSNLYIPPLQKMGSMNLSDEELEFHDINSSPSLKGITFGAESSEHLPPIKSPTKRKNGYSIPAVPPNGEYTIKTDMQVSEIVGELLRAAHTMNMKSVEPITSNRLYCQHKAVNFEVGVRKSSLVLCQLQFEWMHGGSTRVFNDVCQELLRTITL